MIDAAWGLGEAIVSGQVTPDHWVIDKAQGKVLSTTTADKHMMTVRTATGTEEMAVPDCQTQTTGNHGQHCLEIGRLWHPNRAALSKADGY